MPIVSQKKCFKVLGIDISSYSKKEFYQLIDSRLQDENPNSPPFFVVTVNPEIAMQSIVDNEFRQILNNSSINTADGVGISWAVNTLYGKEIERITGSDSVGKICRICAKYNQRVFFYGAMPDVAKKASEKLREQIKGLKVAGTYSPDAPDVALEDLPEKTQYQLKSANVVFVALGAPKQEKWIHTNLPKLPSCKLIIGVGGSFDFIAGHVKRAPSWLQKTGLEWLYRLIIEPQRWRRMLKLPLFALNVLILKISNK